MYQSSKAGMEYSCFYQCGTDSLAVSYSLDPDCWPVTDLADFEGVLEQDLG